jgi:hypothetical protein
MEPPLSWLPGLEAGATSTGDGLSRLGARGDVLVALQSRTSVVDVSITHPYSAPTTASPATDGAAAVWRHVEKHCAYNQLVPMGSPWCPFLWSLMAIGEAGYTFPRKAGYGGG